MSNAIGQLPLAAHRDTAVTLATLGEPREYRPTYPFEGELIDSFHRHLATAPRQGACLSGLPIAGKLRPEDALKLYECSYYATGDVLEFGTNEGLSAWILARGVVASGRDAELTTMEVSKRFCARARANLKREGVSTLVEVVRGDADKTCARLAADGRRFSLAFVDHSHAYEPVVRACQHLEELLEPGSLAVFHDYNDRRNSRRAGLGDSNDEYGVFAAVEEALGSGRFELLGVYGCCGVIRKVG